MSQVNLLAATRTVEKTTPFLLYRLAVCLAVAFGSLLAALVGAGTLIAFASFTAKPGSVGGFGALLGIGAFFFLLFRFRSGLFFNIKAGHLALVAELAKGTKLPEGKEQIDLAQRKSAELFPSPLGFFELTEAVKQVLKALPARHCAFLGGLASKPMAAVLGDLAGRLLQTSDQALISLSFFEGGNPWKSTSNGLALHLRHFDSLSKSRLFLLGFEYLGLVAAFAAMLYPVNSVASALPVDVGSWRYLFALIFAWSLKAAFLEPIATSALADLYIDLAKREDEATEEEFEELSAHSEAFGKIREKSV